jgi:hypothetical protein
MWVRGRVIQTNLPTHRPRRNLIFRLPNPAEHLSNPPAEHLPNLQAEHLQNPPDQLRLNSSIESYESCLDFEQNFMYETRDSLSVLLMDLQDPPDNP